MLIKNQSGVTEKANTGNCSYKIQVYDTMKHREYLNVFLLLKLPYSNVHSGIAHAHTINSSLCMLYRTHVHIRKVHNKTCKYIIVIINCCRCVTWQQALISVDWIWLHVVLMCHVSRTSLILSTVGCEDVCVLSSVHVCLFILCVCMHVSIIYISSYLPFYTIDEDYCK